MSRDRNSPQAIKELLDLIVVGKPYGFDVTVPGREVGDPCIFDGMIYGTVKGKGELSNGDFYVRLDTLPGQLARGITVKYINRVLGPWGQDEFDNFCKNLHDAHSREG